MDGERLKWDEQGRQGGRQRHGHLPMSFSVQDTMAISLMRDILFPIFQEEVRSTAESCSLSKWGLGSLVTIRKYVCSRIAKGCDTAETSSRVSVVRPYGFCGMVLTVDNRG